MSGQLHRLGNGIAVAVDPLAGAESAAIGLYAMVGSRSEPEHLSGLAHLVEHMVFKGAGPRDTRALAEAIENVGGVLNAWTARDQTVFYGRTLAKDAALLTELIADLVRAPHVDEGHLEREKLVILSELGEVTDSPDDLVHDHLFEAAFDGQPLGRSVLGRAETLEAIRRDDCLNWIRDELVPPVPGAARRARARVFGGRLAAGLCRHGHRCDKLRRRPQPRGRIDEPRAFGARVGGRDSRRDRGWPRPGAARGGIADGSRNGAGARRHDGAIDRGVRPNPECRRAFGTAPRGRCGRGARRRRRAARRPRGGGLGRGAARSEERR